MNSSNLVVTSLRPSEIADALIAMFQHDGASREQARMRAGVTIGVHINTIRNWETNYSAPNKTHRAALAMLPGWSLYL